MSAQGGVIYIARRIRAVYMPGMSSVQQRKELYDNKLGAGSVRRLVGYEKKYRI